MHLVKVNSYYCDVIGSKVYNNGNFIEVSFSERLGDNKIEDFYVHDMDKICYISNGDVYLKSCIISKLRSTGKAVSMYIDNETLFVNDKYDGCYAIGNNDYNRLGVGEDIGKFLDSWRYVQLQLPSYKVSLEYQAVRTMHSNNIFTVFVTTWNELCFAGNDTRKIFGERLDDTNYDTTVIDFEYLNDKNEEEPSKEVIEEPKEELNEEEDKDMKEIMKQATIGRIHDLLNLKEEEKNMSIPDTINFNEVLEKYDAEASEKAIDKVGQAMRIASKIMANIDTEPKEELNEEEEEILSFMDKIGLKGDSLERDLDMMNDKIIAMEALLSKYEDEIYKNIPSPSLSTSMIDLGSNLNTQLIMMKIYRNALSNRKEIFDMFGDSKEVEE